MVSSERLAAAKDMVVSVLEGRMTRASAVWIFDDDILGFNLEILARYEPLWLAERLAENHDPAHLAEVEGEMRGSFRSALLDVMKPGSSADGEPDEAPAPAPARGARVETDQILNEINALQAWDYVLRRFDGYLLEVIGGRDETVYRDPSIVIRFLGVSYVDCPVSFSHPLIRTSTNEELLLIAKRSPIEPEDTLFVIEAESMGDIGTQLFFVIAESVTLVRATGREPSQ